MTAPRRRRPASSRLVERVDPALSESQPAASRNASRQTPTPRGPRLDSLLAVRREAARVYRLARHGRLSVCDAARLAHVLSVVGRLIENGELEQRLREIERRLGERGAL